MRILRSVLAKVLAGLLLLPVLVCTSEVLAQEGSVLRPRSPSGTAQSNPLLDLRQRLQQGATTGIPMEGAVDGSEYYVGPGDVFTVSIGGAEPTVLAIPVAADGRLVLPDGASIVAAGLKLDDVRRDAISSLQHRYRNVSLDVALLQPRQFYVHVSGAVPSPGRSLALPVARVSDVLQLAYADTSNAPVSNQDYRPALRNVQVRRRDGTVLSVDLIRYFSTGGTEYNPYVRDGDGIHVPSYSIHSGSVFVNGAVPFPGRYDHRPGDTIDDLLSIAGVGEDYTGIGSVRLAHRSADGTVTSHHLTPHDLTNGSGSLAVSPLDNISADPFGPRSGTASVDGSIRFPGTYAIEPGRTTLRELIALAGGLREDALLRGAYLERDVLPKPYPAMDRQNRFERRMLDLPFMRPDTLAILQYLRQSDLDFLSRHYFASGLRLQNRVSMTLGESLESGAEPILLRDGDRMVIPEDNGTVFVFGRVNRPGYVPHEVGRSAREYVALAGGPSQNASRVYLVEQGSGRHLHADRVEVQSGDIIFVDGRITAADSPELQRVVLDERQRRSQARAQWIQAGISVGSLLLSYLTFREVLK